MATKCDVCEQLGMLKCDTAATGHQAIPVAKQTHVTHTLHDLQVPTDNSVGMLFDPSACHIINTGGAHKAGAANGRN